MRSFGLLLIAMLLTLGLFIPLLGIQTYRRRHNLSKFYENLATNIDYMWGALLYGEDGHTVSAMSYKKNDRWHECRQEPIINAVFQDKFHCENRYKYEFVIKPNLTLKVH